MPIIHRQAVLITGALRPADGGPPDPRRTIEIRAGEDTTFLFAVTDEGYAPISDGDLVLTVRPTPSSDDEKVFRITAEKRPLVGPNVWAVNFGAQETRRKAAEFQRGFYDVVRTVDGRRDFVIPASPFRLFGAPGAA